MSGKRRATYDLNRDNCDEELPKEEAGSWKPADQDILKNRPKLKARRSLANTSSSPASSPFSALTFNFGPPKATGTIFSLSPATATNGSTTGVAPSPTPLFQSDTNDIDKSKAEQCGTPEKGKSFEDRLKEIQEKRTTLLAEKQRIEAELMQLEQEETKIKESEKPSSSANVEDETGKLLPNDEELELPPEEPWN